MAHFGLDIGSKNIKLVELKTGKVGHPTVVAFGMTETPANALVSESRLDFDKLVETLKKLILDARVDTDQVVSVPPEIQTFTRVKTLPKLSDTELKSALRWEADQDTPLPLSEVYLSYQVISREEGNSPTAQMEVMIVTVPKKVINKHLEILKVTGLKPLAVETETLAATRSLVSRLENPPTTLLINLGAEVTSLAVVSASRLVFTRAIKTAGEAFTRALMAELELSREQAEEYKKTYGLDQTKLEGKVAAALKPVFDVIVEEIKRAITAYESRTKDGIKRVVLLGGSSKMPNVVLYLAQNLSLEVQIGDPWYNLTKPVDDEEILADKAPFYAVAVGLALKEV